MDYVKAFDDQDDRGGRVAADWWILGAEAIK